MRNAGLDEAQAGIKTARRNINNLRYADDTTLMAEREEELRSRLMKVKEESEKTGLKLNIQITKVVIETVVKERDKWHSKMQNSRVFFSPGASSEESPPKAEHPGFVLGIFYTP